MHINQLVTIFELKTYLNHVYWHKICFIMVTILHFAL
jgi:hypothetical protein